MKATVLFLPFIVVGLVAFVNSIPIPVLAGLAPGSLDISARDEAGANFEVDDLAPRGKDKTRTNQNTNRKPDSPEMAIEKAEKRRKIFSQQLESAKHELKEHDQQVAELEGRVSSLEGNSEDLAATISKKQKERLDLVNKVENRYTALRIIEGDILDAQKFIKVRKQFSAAGYDPPAIGRAAERKKHMGRWPTAEWEKALKARLRRDSSALELQPAPRGQGSNDVVLASSQPPHQGHPHSHRDQRTQYFPMGPSANHPHRIQAQLPHHAPHQFKSQQPACLHHENQDLVGLTQPLLTMLPSMNHPQPNQAQDSDLTPEDKILQANPEFVHLMLDLPDCLKEQSTHPPLSEQPQFSNPAPPPFPNHVPSAVNWPHPMVPMMGPLFNRGFTAQFQSPSPPQLHHEVPPPPYSVYPPGQMTNYPQPAYQPHTHWPDPAEWS